MTKSAVRLAVAVALVLTLGACSSNEDGLMVPVDAAPATHSAAPSPTKGKVRVAALMKTAGCKGKVIGTQMYSRETGRCNLASGGEVTIATFDTTKLRDEWVKFGADFGGNFATGKDWAAWCANLDDAETVAKKLAGKVM
jgi:hypothetical protein